jgi:hypothetical protein
MLRSKEVYDPVKIHHKLYIQVLACIKAGTDCYIPATPQIIRVETQNLMIKIHNGFSSSSGNFEFVREKEGTGKKKVCYA